MRAETISLYAPRPRISCAAVLAALLVAGCLEADAPGSDEPGAAVPGTDTAGILVPGSDGVDSLAMDTAGSGTVTPANEPRPLQPAPSPSLSIPVSGSRNDTTQVARAVFGVAEIQVDSSTYTPADYLRVFLQDGRRTYETLTDRSGQFVFEDVPAGRYQLVFMTATKDQRILYEAPVTVAAGGKVALPAVHIPLGSMRVRG